MTSRHQNAGQNHNIQADDEYLENVAAVTYLGKTAKDRNWACEEVTSWRAAQRVLPWLQHTRCVAAVGRRGLEHLNQRAMGPTGSMHGREGNVQCCCNVLDIGRSYEHIKMAWEGVQSMDEVSLRDHVNTTVNCGLIKGGKREADAATRHCV
jgi:hypothetical protein